MKIEKVDDVPVHYNAVEVLERNLTVRPDKVALFSVEREMTFREVSQEVNRVGNALRKLDVRIGDCVAILSPDLPEWVTAFFGALKVGAIAVGMNTTLTAREYAFMLDDCRARVLFVHDSLLPLVDEI